MESHRRNSLSNMTYYKHNIFLNKTIHEDHQMNSINFSPCMSNLLSRHKLGKIWNSNPDFDFRAWSLVRDSASPPDEHSSQFITKSPHVNCLTYWADNKEGNNDRQSDRRCNYCMYALYKEAKKREKDLKKKREITKKVKAIIWNFT